MNSQTSRLILVAVVAGLVGGVGGGLLVKATGKPSSPPARFRSLEASRLKLVDDDQRTRIEMWTQKDGAVLTLTDPSLGDASRPRVMIDSSKNASLGFYDTNGMLRARIGMAEGGTPVLALYDAKGKVVWQAP